MGNYDIDTYHTSTKNKKKEKSLYRLKFPAMQSEIGALKQQEWNRISLQCNHRTNPVPINGKDIKASYENSVLRIIVPKYNKDVVTEIQIE